MSYYLRVIDVKQERDVWGLWADAVDLDLKKAFDRVPHRRLMWKIECRNIEVKTSKLDGGLSERQDN